MKRALFGGLVAILLALGAALVPAHPAHAAEADTLHTLVNQARASNGQPALVRNWALDQVAAAWAVQMAAANALSHNPAYSAEIPSGWVSAAENVAQGHPTAAAMHDAWMTSSGHRGNILGDFTDIGIAFLSANGSTWGVEVFAAYPAHAAPPAPPAPAPEPAPADPAPVTDSATNPAPGTPRGSPTTGEESGEANLPDSEALTTEVPPSLRSDRSTYRSSGGSDARSAVSHVERAVPSADGWLWVPVVGAVLLAAAGAVVVLRRRGLIGPTHGRHAPGR